MCFGPLPISEHVWLSLSLLIDWFISPLMLEIESTSQSALKIHGLAECTDCILSSAVCLRETFTAAVWGFTDCASVFLSHFPSLFSQHPTPSLPKQRPSCLPSPLFQLHRTLHPPSRPCSPIPHPFRGAWEHAVEITEPIKTLPGSIHSVCLT